MMMVMITILSMMIVIIGTFTTLIMVSNHYCDIIVAVIYVDVYILDFEPNKKIFSAPRRSGPLYKEMVQVCCLAKSGGIDKRTNKIHKNSNFLNYRSWSKLPGRRGRQSPRRCRTFPRFLHNQQAKMRATTILKWSKLKLNIKTKHSIPLSTGKVLTAINSSPSCGLHQMWDLRLLASFLLLFDWIWVRE